MKKQLALALAITFTFTACGEKQTYKTVKIGEQVWMAENLNYEAEGSKCYDDKPDNCKKYGRLYDWETAMKACPSGWHLPSKEEWDKLIEVAGDRSAGKYLKATSSWNENGNGTDAYGFAALPGGIGNSDGGFSNGGNDGYWWSSSESSNDAYIRMMSYGLEESYWSYYGKNLLLSVRCIQGDAKEAEAKKAEAQEVEEATAEAEEAAAEEATLPKTKAECPSKKIGSPITVEAVFLGSACGEGCTADFRLANGKTISLDGQIDENELKEGTKVSITYQKEQGWLDLDFIGQGQSCQQSDNLESWKEIGK